MLSLHLKNMAKNPSRLISTGLWLVRQLSTAAREVPPWAHCREKPERLYLRLSALAATGGSVKKTLNRYIDEGRNIRKDMLLECIKELRRYQKFDHALEIMKWMKKRRMNFTHADRAIHLDLIAKSRGIPAAENYFSCLKPSVKNHLTYGALLNCYCKELMSDKAYALFEEMDDKDFLSNSLPFNNLLILHMRLGQPEKVLSLVDEMKQRNISLCKHTYIFWLQSYGSLNDLEGVERVLDEMKKDSEKNYDWTTYSNLAAIYVKAGLFEKAGSALKMLEALMGCRDREAYHFLISLYAGTSNLEEVNRVWNSLKSSFHKTTNHSYLIMLQALAKLKDFEGLMKCFMEWKPSFHTYDMRLANVVIKAYLQQDMLEEASLIFDHAFKKARGPFFEARDMFMVFFLKIRRLDLALTHMKAAFTEVKDKEWPNERIVNAFFNYYEEEKDVDGAESLCQILKLIKRLDSNAYNWLMKTYVAADRLAPEMRQKLEDDKIEISHELESLLERVCPKIDLLYSSSIF